MASPRIVFISDSVIHCQTEGDIVPTSLSELEAQRERLKLRLSSLGDLRPGSLAERYRKCGKPNCHCAQPGQTGHGPSWSLTHDVKGKTATRIIPEALVPQTREQIAEYRRLRDLTRDLVEVNEQICEGRIENRKTEDDSKKNVARRATGPRRRR
jgi:hypothetical protein